MQQVSCLVIYWVVDYLMNVNGLIVSYPKRTNDKNDMLKTQNWKNKFSILPVKYYKLKSEK